MADSPLRNLGKRFAKAIVLLARELRKIEPVLSNQLLRAGTSIGANIHEAQYAQSGDDFVSKLKIALKECYETEYWLELLFETDCIEKRLYEEMQDDCGSIRRMLISSINTTIKNRT